VIHGEATVGAMNLEKTYKQGLHKIYQLTGCHFHHLHPNKPRRCQVNIIEKLEALQRYELADYGERNDDGSGGYYMAMAISGDYVSHDELRAIIEEAKKQAPVACTHCETGVWQDQLCTACSGTGFTHPQLSDETVKDAERYRWLRSGGKDLGGEVFMYGYSPKGLDESIDEAMKADNEPN
jgi:hypothetical protein